MGWTTSEQQARRKGPWSPEEDKLLTEYVSLHGGGGWSSVAKYARLNRSGKSCRLRWVNYLRPGLKRGQITPQEAGIIIELHALWGNKWSTIAQYLPGRTDNGIKNYWRTHFKEKDKTSQKIRNRRTQILKQKQLQQQQQQQRDQETTRPSAEMPFTTNIYPTNKIEEQQHYTHYNSNYNNNNIVYRQESNEASWVEEYLGQRSGLWNFEEQQQPQAPPPPPAQQQPDQGQGQGRVQDQMQDCSKIAMQNQANGFTWGWDPNNALYNNNGGCIF